MATSKTFIFVFYAALFALATGLQNNTIGSWPSLRLRFSVKRTASQVHGQSEFSVLATPTVSLDDTSSVLYNAVTTFKEDGMTYKYSLVDGVAYVSRTFWTKGGNPAVECSRTAGILSSVNLIVKALSEAKAVSNIRESDGSVVLCSSDNSFKVSVNDIEFGVCYNGSSGFTIFGSDMDINVEYLEAHLPIRAPKIDRKTNKYCEKVVSPSFVTSIGKSFLTGEPISDEERGLKGVVDAIDVLVRGSCTCKSTPRPCIFVHGLGSLSEKEKNLDSFNDYWGNLTDHTPCCSSTQYAMLNTVNSSWTDHLLQEKICDHVLAVSGTSTGLKVSDTIIITHSMGGLILAGAIANNKCKLASSTIWASIGAPMLGSMASNYFQDSCKGRTNVVMEKYVESTELCPADDAIQSLAYQNGSYSTPALNRLYQSAQVAYRKNVHAVMCSNSYSGLVSSYQPAFWFLGSVITHKFNENDGMVEYHSCAGGFPKSKFSTSYRKPFYVSELNHYDLAFKAGDAFLDEAKMPVKWFECLL